jgi:polyisoprenoid-binding protein YceI
MKKVLLVVSVLIITVISLSAFRWRENRRDLTTYSVLNDYSKVEWVGSKKTGFHQGSFKLKSGEVKLDGNKLAGGKFVIDLTSLKLIGEGNPKFEEHLKAKDFFETAVFSEATYEINSVDYISETDVKINGSLNLKGISLPLSIPAIIRNSDDKRFFGQAFFSLDRTLWGINYGVGTVAKDVQVSVYLFANK